MQAPRGDKGIVLRKLPHLLALVLLALLAAASPAFGTSGRLIAPPSACPEQELEAPAEAQETAMLCMTNFARAQAGQLTLSPASELAQSAADKGDDILRCDSFSHFACGREFTYWMKQTGYISSQCWRAGENLAWGTGGYGTVRSIFRAWMRSPGHRANLLGDFTQIGISLRVGVLSGNPEAHIWAQHFGSHCETPSAAR